MASLSVFALPLATILIPFTVAAAAPDREAANADTILAKVQERTERQRAAQCGYTATRQYTLENKHVKPPASMKVRLIFRREAGKHFDILSVQHASGFVRHVLLELLSTETSASTSKEDNGVNGQNYSANLLGQEVEKGYNCFHLALTPRKKSKFLLDGEAWIDTETCAIVRMKGHTSKSVSFWVGKPDLDEYFAPFQGFWMPSYTRSDAHVKLVGETVVIIEYLSYQFDGTSCGK